MKRALQKGFTLIELVVVIVILGILAAIAVPQFTDLAGEARTAVVNASCGAAHSAAVLLYASKKTNSTSAEIRNFMTVSGGVTVSIAGCNVSVTPPGTTTSVPCTSSNPIPSVLCSG
jgi:MSHA pilin protein MshA